MQLVPIAILVASRAGTVSNVLLTATVTARAARCSHRPLPEPPTAVEVRVRSNRTVCPSAAFPARAMSQWCGGPWLHLRRLPGPLVELPEIGNR